MLYTCTKISLNDYITLLFRSSMMLYITGCVVIVGTRTRTVLTCTNFISIHLFRLEFACDDIHDPKDQMQAGCSIRCML